MQTEKKSIDWDMLHPAAPGWGVGHEKIPPLPPIVPERIEAHWRSHVSHLYSALDPNLDAEILAAGDTVERFVLDKASVETALERAVAIAMLCNDVTLNPFPLFFAQWGLRGLLDAIIDAQSFRFSEFTVHEMRDDVGQQLQWHAIVCRRAYCVRHAIAISSEETQTELKTLCLDRATHVGTRAVVAFLFNDSHLAEASLASIEGLGSYGKSLEPFLAVVRDEDWLNEIARYTRNISWVAPALIRNVGEFAARLAPRFTPFHFGYAALRNNDSLRIIRAIQPPNIKAALQCARFSADFDVARTLVLDPDLASTLDELTTDSEVGVIADVYRQRLDQPRPDLGITADADPPPEPTEPKVSKRKRETYRQSLIQRFEFGLLEGVVRGDVTSSTSFFSAEELDAFPWERWEYAPTERTKEIDQLMARSSRAKLAVLNQTGHAWRTDAATGDSLLYGNREALEDLGPKEAIVVATPFVDHPHFHVRELAARTLRASLYQANDPVGRLMEGRTVKDPEKLLAFLTDGAHQQALFRAAKLPPWMLQDVVARPKEIGGAEFSLQDTHLFLASVSRLAGHIIQWSDDVTMAVTMIDTFLSDELGDEAPEAFSHRVDYDSLEETALSVTKLREVFGERMGWVYGMLMVFGGQRGVDALFDEIGRTYDVSFNPLDMLASSDDTAVLSRLIEARNKLSFIDERAVDRAIERAATRQGLTAFSTWMINAPTFGISGERSEVLLSGRLYEISFADPTAPVVFKDGKRLKKLPRPKDPAQLETYEGALALIRDVKSASQRVVELIEQSMGKRERIPFQIFRNRVIGHPWLGVICRRVVWGHYEPGRKVAPFRVDEFGEIVDAEEEVIVPSVRGMVGVLSPKELSETDQQRWVSILTSYEMTQPFDQFARSLG